MKYKTETNNCQDLTENILTFPVALDYAQMSDHLIRLHGTDRLVHAWQIGCKSNVWGTLSEVWSRLKSFDAQGLDIWCSIGEADPDASRKGNKRGIVAPPLYYYLDDDLGLVSLDLLSSCGWVVLSGGIRKDGTTKKHIYIPVPVIEDDSRTGMQRMADYLEESKVWATQLGTDPAVCDIGRVTRLVGSCHFKNGRVPVTLHSTGSADIKLDPKLNKVSEYRNWYKLADIFGAASLPDRFSTDWKAVAASSGNYLAVHALTSRGVNGAVTGKIAHDSPLRSRSDFYQTVLSVLKPVLEKYPLPKFGVLSEEDLLRRLKYLQVFALQRLKCVEIRFVEPDHTTPAIAWEGPDSLWWAAAESSATNWMSSFEGYWDGRPFQKARKTDSGFQTYTEVNGLSIDTVREPTLDTICPDTALASGQTVGEVLEDLRASGRASIKVECPVCNGGSTDSYLNIAGTLVCFREEGKKRRVEEAVKRIVKPASTDGLNREHKWMPDFEKILSANGQSIQSIQSAIDGGSRVLVLLKGGTGTGKSHILEGIKKNFNFPGYLAVASHKSLNGQYALRHNVSNYLEFAKKEKWDTEGMSKAVRNQGLTVTPNTQHRVSFPDGGVFVADEYMEVSQTITHADTFDHGQRLVAFTTLRNNMACAGMTIVADAFLTPEAKEEVIAATGAHIVIDYEHNFSRHCGQTRYIIPNMVTAMELIKRMADRKEKIDVPCNQMSTSKTITEFLKVQRPDAKTKVYHSDNSQGLQEEIANLGEGIKSLDYLVRSPTISSGHNWNDTGFDAIVGVFDRPGATVSSAVQQLCRDRNVDVPMFILARNAKTELLTAEEIGDRIKSGATKTSQLLTARVPADVARYEPISGPLFDSYCLNESQRLKEAHRLQDGLVEFFQGQGGKVVFVSPHVETKEEKTARVEAKTTWQERDIKEILNADTLGEEALKRIQAGGASTSEESRSYQRHTIQSFLGDSISLDHDIVSEYGLKQGIKKASRFANLQLCLDGESQVVAASDMTSRMDDVHGLHVSHNLSQVGWVLLFLRDWYGINLQQITKDTPLAPLKTKEEMSEWLRGPSALPGFATLQDEIRSVLLKISPMRKVNGQWVDSQMAVLGQLLRIFGLKLASKKVSGVRSYTLDMDQLAKMREHSLTHRERLTAKSNNLYNDLRKEALPEVLAWAEKFSKVVEEEEYLDNGLLIHDMTPHATKWKKDHASWLSEVRKKGAEPVIEEPIKKEKPRRTGCSVSDLLSVPSLAA